MAKPWGKSLPPDPSRPDQLSEAIRQQIVQFLRDPLNYPDELNQHIASYGSLNAIQSVTA